jgi:hypothetical protein
MWTWPTIVIMTIRFGARTAFAAMTVAGAVALTGSLWAQKPRIERAIPWAASGTWLRAETHVHSKFSDGNYTVEQLVARASANGCDVLAVTDHTDAGLRAATPAYHAAIADARAKFPNVTVLDGIEWNVPPGKGQDHAVLLLPPDFDPGTRMGTFKERFDDGDKEGENPELAVAAFAWLRQQKVSTGAPVMFLNHPSRRAADVAAVFKHLAWLESIGRGILAGVEGAPGHQKAKVLGAYGSKLKPEDRWDPAVAPPGGAWDQMLASGAVLSGALATADFHSENSGDYFPCQFSFTAIYARDRSPAAVLDALRAGSFVGVHGGIVRDVRFSLTASGLPRPAVAGEIVRLPAGSRASLELAATVPALDWQGEPNTIDQIELIAITRSGSSVVHTGALANGVLRYDIEVPAGGIVVRARGRRVVADGPDLLFYTNPIFVR